MARNSINSLLNQQCGFSIWRNSDIPIKRFRCNKTRNYTHLLSNRDADILGRDTPIFTCKFSPQDNQEHLLALANEDGKLAIHDTNNDSRYGLHAHNNAIFDLAWMFDQMKLVTASGDHTSKLFDLGQGDIRTEKVFCGHTRSVKTVAFRKDDTSVFATGGRDGNIILWDTRTNCSSYVGRADRTINNSHTAKVFTPSKSRKKFSTPSQSGIKSVTGLVFQDNNTLISCGAGDGVIKIWDLRKNYVTYKKEAAPRSTIPYPGNTTKNGYSSLLLDNEGVKLFANCLDNTIYCYNVATYNTEPVMYYRGHQNSTFYVKSSLSKDGSYLISGSSDENAYIWNTKYSAPIVKLTGHSAEVTCVAWCASNSVLITCSDDMTHKIWSIGNENLPDNWDVDGRGKAEVLPINNFSNITLEKPTTKRTLLFEETSTPKRQFLECEKCFCPTDSQSCCSATITTTVKRKSICELDHEDKIQQTEFGPRRLFSKMCCNNEKTDILANNLENNEDALPVKLRRIEESTFDESDEIDNENYEPSNKLAKCVISSPTVNLPNFIVDGTAPHINYSPPKRRSHDWLTKLRIENQLRREMYEKSTEAMSLSSPRSTKPPAESRRSRSKAAVQIPLLNYFKVTNNVQKCEMVVSPKLQECGNIDLRH